MPSAANLSQRDLERLRSLTFFLDYQIGRYVVADALRKVGASVEVHIDHFAPAASDLEWINYPYRVVYIRFIGTHSQYDAIDAQTL